MCNCCCNESRGVDYRDAGKTDWRFEPRAPEVPGSGLEQHLTNDHLSEDMRVLLRAQAANKWFGRR